jgi:transposase
VSTTGARYRMSLISAVTSRGHLRFMIKEKGGVNAAVFIEFLKRLMIGAKSKIFLIVDRGPAHVAKKTKAFVAGLGGKLRLFYLPPYSPDRNPDELRWKHLKADTVGRTSITQGCSTLFVVVHIAQGFEASEGSGVAILGDGIGLIEREAAQSPPRGSGQC